MTRFVEAKLWIVTNSAFSFALVTGRSGPGVSYWMKVNRTADAAGVVAWAAGGASGAARAHAATAARTEQSTLSASVVRQYLHLVTPVQPDLVVVQRERHAVRLRQLLDPLAVHPQHSCCVSAGQPVRLRIAQVAPPRVDLGGQGFYVGAGQRLMLVPPPAPAEPSLRDTTANRRGRTAQDHGRLFQGHRVHWQLHAHEGRRQSIQLVPESAFHELHHVTTAARGRAGSCAVVGCSLRDGDLTATALDRAPVDLSEAERHRQLLHVSDDAAIVADAPFEKQARAIPALHRYRRALSIRRVRSR